LVLQVTNSPFSQEQAELLNRVLPTLSDAQKIWLSGFLAAHSHALLSAPQGGPALPAGTSAAVSEQGLPAAVAGAVPKEATVLYGSQTGNSQKLAKRLADRLQQEGVQVTLSAMNEFKPNTLKKVRLLFIIVSTHGEGDPPDNALSFYEFLHSKRAPQLDQLQFSVLALGDTSYERFCQTGKDFDKRLEELGGRRLVPRVDCDVDYDEAAAGWIDRVVGALGEQANAPAAAGSAQAAAALSVAPAAAGTPVEYSRSNPFWAEVLQNINLNGRGSKRETRHIELSLEGSSLRYEPGDCLGVFPENHPGLIGELLEETGWRPDEPVKAPKTGEDIPLYDALAKHYEITVLTRPLLEQIAERFGVTAIADLLAAGKEEEFRAYVRERDLLDLVRDFGLKGLPAAEFVPLLRKMPHRLYSISSSPSAYPEEAHLLIRKVSYEAHGRTRYGVCSTFVAERLNPGDTLPVFVHHNPNFKLPGDPEVPVIMIGPGTGVAPFRAFLGERAETGASGKTWLFYGDHHFTTDFLYQTEWQRWLKEGVLTRMDVAFSRDTDRKIYVQHRMLEKSRDLFGWLQEGAHVYVCGDEKRMAHDVHEALASILEREGGWSRERALEYLSQMQQEKRYQRDVY